MTVLHYIGFDVHKKTISYCVKTAAGDIVDEGKVAAEREGLRQWAAARPQPWRGAMEATLFSAWILPLQVSGDLRLLLTFTYHGCPRIFPTNYHSVPILPRPRLPFGRS
jgi:hypothetical protein